MAFKRSGVQIPYPPLFRAARLKKCISKSAYFASRRAPDQNACVAASPTLMCSLRASVASSHRWHFLLALLFADESHFEVRIIPRAAGLPITAKATHGDSAYAVRLP